MSSVSEFLPQHSQYFSWSDYSKPLEQKLILLTPNMKEIILDHRLVSAFVILFCFLLACCVIIIEMF